MRRAIAYLAALLVLLAAPAFGEFECVSEVGYQWKKGDDKEPRNVPYSLITRKGAGEAEAREALGRLVALEKQKAEAQCRKEHESLSACVAGHFTQNATVLASLGFRARKALEDAVTSDCQGQQGQCLNGTAGEAKCQERIKPAAAKTTEAAEEKKDAAGKKDAGKKDAGKKK